MLVMIFPKSDEKGIQGGHPLQGGGAPGGRMKNVLETRGNLMVVLTILSVILSAAVGLAWLSPVLEVAAIFPFFAVAMRRREHHRSLALVVRWAAAVFTTTIAVGVFVPEQVGNSVPFSHLTMNTIQNWIRTPGAPPPADYGYLLWGFAGFLLATLASGGLLGLVLTSVGLGNAAVGVLWLFRYGVNVVQIALVAVPLWQWCILGAAILTVAPASLPFFERFVRNERVAESRQVLRKFMVAGGACLIASLLLRLATADLWRAILREWTIF